jgi:serine/threonine protein kinase
MVISAGSASRIAAEVRALRALDGTGGSIPTDDDDDDDVDASRSLFPRFHDFYLAPSSSPVGGWDAHLVSSMCPGARDLRAYLRAARDRGRCGLPESQARFYLAELAAALHAVHTVARLAHGDVKPENVAVSSATGHISLVDFDLSTDLGDRGVQRPSSPAMDENCQNVGTRVVVAGTEAYMSPELIAGDPRDAASDWWAFAVVAYELVHGRVPFGSPKSRHPFSSRVHVPSARVHFPAADEGGPDPALSEDMKGMIVAMTRRPAAGVWDRLGGWAELAHCGCFEGLTRVPRVAVPREDCWVTLPGDEWGT